MDTADKPIGWWLKHLDRLIEGSFEGALADRGLTRRHWQVVNVLQKGAATREAVAEALRPFWTPGAGPDATGPRSVEPDPTEPDATKPDATKPDATGPEEILDDLAARGWTEPAGPAGFRLTTAGEAARTAAAERVREVRGAITRGITELEYRAAVDVLRRMAENLEQESLEQRDPKRVR